MSTRKLILTALVCGLAIMLAGGLKLFQVATDEVDAVVLQLGTEQKLGDMTVSVTDVQQETAGTYVTVSMRGVDSADGVEGWKMFANGELSDPLAESDGEECVTKVARVVSCVLQFPPSAGSSVTVFYKRAEASAQWAP